MKNIRFNFRNKLVDIELPAIMGIINYTPDSYYANSRVKSIDQAINKVQSMINDGAAIIDIGAESTRPQATPLTAEEEIDRLSKILPFIRKNFPNIIISIDTYHAKTAKYAIDEGADIINDISSGLMDPEIITIVANAHIPYVAMHMQGTPSTMQINPHYDNVIMEINYFFSERLHVLHDAGINDIIIDPGFGFGKTIEHNYQILNHLKDFTIHEKPILVGLSRKSMIYKALNISPEDALCPTSALNLQALLNNADILRVHDVKEANYIIQLYKLIKSNQ
jgi:dihydropteroate synthase